MHVFCSLASRNENRMGEMRRGEESGNDSFSALSEGFKKMSPCSKKVLSSKNNGKS